MVMILNVFYYATSMVAPSWKNAMPVRVAPSQSMTDILYFPSRRNQFRPCSWFSVTDPAVSRHSQVKVRLSVTEWTERVHFFFTSNGGSDEVIFSSLTLVYLITLQLTYHTTYLDQHEG